MRDGFPHNPPLPLRSLRSLASPLSPSRASERPDPSLAPDPTKTDRAVGAFA